MTADTFIQNFDLLAEAPGGVPKLREMILELAVSGRLVPQDSKNESAGAGTMNLAYLDDVPYTIPKQWRWTTLRSVSQDLGQKVPDNVFTYIDVSSIDKDRGRIGDGVQVLRPEDAPSRARKIVKVGTVIYSTVRPYLLNIAVVDRAFDPAPIVSTAFFVMHPFACVYSPYLFYYLRSQRFTEYVNAAMTGMAYPAVNDGKMSVGPFPLPPLAEQKRIVARVDELMKRCDELEARQNERIERHTILVSSCLHALSTSARAPHFILHPSSFNLLLTSPASVAELRKTILQLAVQGRLVPQDPRDEPAGCLIALLTKERDRLVARGKKRKQDPLPPVRTEQRPFELPPGWDWVRLGSLGITQTGTTPPKSNPRFFGPGYPFVKPGDITESGVNYANEELTEEGLHAGRLIPDGAAVMVCIGGSIGKVGYFDRDCSCNQQINAISPLGGIDGKFLALWMKSPLVQDQVLHQAPQTTLPILSKGKWGLLLLPLPPLAEQKRIVAKVNELMALCDAMEAKLTQSREDADTLAAAVVHHLCSDGIRPKEATA